MDTVTLVNGATESRTVVASTMQLIKSLGAAHFMPAYSLCKGTRTSLPKDTEKALIQAGVLEANGEIHSSFANVAISAMLGARWEEGSFRLGNPIAE